MDADFDVSLLFFSIDFGAATGFLETGTLEGVGRVV